MLSHEPSVKSVREKGDALLDLVQDVALKDKIDKLQSDYEALCSAGKVRRWQKPNTDVFTCQKRGPDSFFSVRKIEGLGWVRIFSFI